MYLCFLSKFENLIIVEDKEIRKNTEAFHFIHLHSHYQPFSLYYPFNLHNCIIKVHHTMLSAGYFICNIFVKMHHNLH